MKKMGWIERVATRFNDGESLVYIGGAILTILLFLAYQIT